MSFLSSRAGKIFKILLLWALAGGPGPALSAPGDPVPFDQALPGYTYQFPRDFYSHDRFRIEWWYYTGNLKAVESGRRFGFQLTFFRVGLEGTEKIQNPSRWKVDQAYFAHMTVSDIEEEDFYFFERINRKGILNAGAKQDRFLVWNEDWILTFRNGGHRLKAREDGTGLDLKLVPQKDLVFHGRRGVSQKGPEPGHASHYFSYTRMKTAGTLWVKGKAYAVEGTSWMDHEFSSHQMAEHLVGWDWFSLKLDNQRELMLYQLRQKDGGIDPFSSGSLVRPDGSHRHLEKKRFTIEATGRWTSEHTGIEYPSGWIVALPEQGVRLTVTPELLDQELHHLRSIDGSYWEGSVSIEGTWKGKPVQGRGYVELVGYGQPLKQELPE